MPVKMPVKVPVSADIDNTVDHMVDDISPSRTPCSKSTFLSFHLQIYISVRLKIGFPVGNSQDVTRMLLVMHAQRLLLPMAMDSSGLVCNDARPIREDPLGCNQCYSLLMNDVATNFFLPLYYLVQSHNCQMVVVVIL